MAVRVDLLVSLDGFATTTDQTPDNPFGQDWSRLTGTYIATRTFQERVLRDNSGKGTTGLDDDYAKDYFDNIGAEIMGAGKFGLHNFPMIRTGRGGGVTSRLSTARSLSSPIRRGRQSKWLAAPPSTFSPRPRLKRCRWP